MIVPMRKLYLAARSSDRERLLEQVRSLGVVHLTPVDPQRAGADEGVKRQLDIVQRAIQVMREVRPQGAAPDVAPMAAAEEIIDIQRRSAEGRHRLGTLHRELEELEMWGDVRLGQIEQLRSSGIQVSFHTVPQDAVDQVRADCVVTLAPFSGRRVLVAVAARSDQVTLPEGSTPVPLPTRDAPSIRAEAGEIDARLKKDVVRLAELAHLVGALRTEEVRLQQEADFTAALRGATEAERIFAVQGWIPADAAAVLPQRLAEAGIDAVVHTLEPDAEEQPPTLIRRPRWAQPIEGLFKMLGTVPGYREFDVSVPFMLALPVFAAILICDGGYGALLLLGPLLAWKKVAAVLGEQFTKLMVVIGAVTIIWGILTASFFGFTLYKPIIPANLGEESRIMLMKMSFWMGAIHLSIAQLWQASAFFPDLRFLCRIGWAIFIWGMFGVVHMFVLRADFGWHTPWPYLLIVGGTLAALFAHPSRNVAKMVALGVASFPLSMLSAFSDVISYVRLMAVGLASTVLAASFNDMALGLGHWPLAVPVLFFGHALTFALGMIALFAHGVRLNMLEFSSNLGMQWTGYQFSPFQTRLLQEA